MVLESSDGLPSGPAPFTLETVTVKELEVDKKKTYKIVGKDEADISKNLIYFKSPIGKALIGRSLEDMVVVETPSGEKTFEVLDIQYI